MSAAAGLLLAGNCLAEAERRGSLLLDGIPAPPVELLERLQGHASATGFMFADWDPRGGMLVRSRAGETVQLHHLAEPMAEPRQLTFFDEPVAGGLFPPRRNATGFLFTSDRGGDENDQIFWHDMKTGESRKLTDGLSRNGGVLWSNRDGRFAYFSTRRNGVSWDIYAGRPGRDWRSHELVMATDGAYIPVDWAPDDSELLVLEQLPVDREGHGARNIARFDRRGDGIYLVSDEDTEFRTLRHQPRRGRERLLTGDLPWDVELIEISRNGRWLAYAANEDGNSRLQVRDLRRGGHVELPQLPAGVINGIRFDRRSRKLAVNLEAPGIPGDIYSIDMTALELVRWTRSADPPDREDPPATPERFRYPTFDEIDGRPREIPALIYRPRGDGPHPVVVHIHGGPEAQERPRHSSSAQFVVRELGAAWVAPNVRGSTGYGRTYLDLDNGKQREDAVRDIGALLDWIAAQPELDEQSVVVTGASYGGYMVLASLMHYGDRLLGGVNVVGISNFVTFLEGTEAYRRDLRRAEYGDEREPEMREFLQSISPLNNAERIQRPLYVAHGVNDPRVPVSEAERIVDAVRENGQTVWYLLAEDEGHGFKRRSNRAFHQAVAMNFIRKLFDGELE
jgi:protease II